ncbi:MAG: 3-phosphoshikimate 1-carboxyvinyltransferase [Clostridia bacterium]|nr:3-phosphoshikimate 1-carboxyvinyltransferase [Clostridia bacterium]
MDIRIEPSKLNGKIQAQPSKSDAHRKIICASLAKGESLVDNVILSEDIEATMRGMESAGCKYDCLRSSGFPGRIKLAVRGIGNMARMHRKVDCGESGSTLRFLSMIFAALGGETSFTGKGSLPVRPMDGALELYSRHGIEYRIPGNGMNLPLEISGRLSGNEFHVDASVTSQFLSGLLMALPAAGISGTVYADGYGESTGYVEMTIDAMNHHGVCVHGGNPFEIPGNEGFMPRKLAIEGDWSNASYFLAMNAMGSDILIEGLSDDSRQPDRSGAGMIGKISMGAEIEADVSQCPDLMPALAVVAAASSGVTHITGGRRLRVKESDRIKSVLAGLLALGADASELDDGMVIRGGKPIYGGTVDSFNDHRIAMAFSSLCQAAKGDIIIKGAECVSKSYPGFFEDLRKMGGRIV